mmetsp:Transcript_110953/g.312807  ORF Transcript_110953/g.312807 Transcript_110953/m.312807 type:complete len:396 (-) Transcript_110953:439-1626(-)
MRAAVYIAIRAALGFAVRLLCATSALAEHTKLTAPTAELAVRDVRVKRIPGKRLDIFDLQTSAGHDLPKRSTWLAPVRSQILQRRSDCAKHSSAAAEDGGHVDKARNRRVEAGVGLSEPPTVPHLSMRRGLRRLDHDVRVIGKSAGQRHCRRSEEGRLLLSGQGSERYANHLKKAHHLLHRTNVAPLRASGRAIYRPAEADEAAQRLLVCEASLLARRTLVQWQWRAAIHQASIFGRKAAPARRILGRGSVVSRWFHRRDQSRNRSGCRHRNWSLANPHATAGVAANAMAEHPELAAPAAEVIVGDAAFEGIPCEHSDVHDVKAIPGHNMPKRPAHLGAIHGQILERGSHAAQRVSIVVQDSGHVEEASGRYGAHFASDCRRRGGGPRPRARSMS